MAFNVKNYNEKILVIENDPILRKVLARRLDILGYRIFLATEGKQALTCFNKVQPHLVIINLILAKLDGYEVCRKIREISKKPIIVLASLSCASDRILGLKLGVDDYLVKPFSPKELEIRIHLILKSRRQLDQKIPNKRRSVLYFGNFIVNTNKKQVFKNNRLLKLTNIEYDLFELLIENAGKELSRTTILDNIWGYTPERAIDGRIIDVHVSRLRAKIEDNPSKPDLILTVRGKGYVFQPY